MSLTLIFLGGTYYSTYYIFTSLFSVYPKHNVTSTKTRVPVLLAVVLLVPECMAGTWLLAEGVNKGAEVLSMYSWD